MLNKEQLKERKKGLGGSDIAAICNVHPYKTSLDVYYDKISPEISTYTNTAIQLGNYLEKFVSEEYEKEIDAPVEEPTKTYRHPKYEYLFAHPDRILPDRNLLEIKTCGEIAANQWGSDISEIPPQCLFQVAHYRSIFNCDFVDIRTLVSNKEIRKYRYEKDSELEGLMTKISINFWNNHVLKRIPPPLKFCKDFSKTFSTPQKSKEADDKIIEKLAEFRKIQQQKSEILEKEEEYKLLFANYLEDSEILKDSLGTELMSFKKIEKRFFDTTSFKKDCPEEYEKYCKSSTYRSMRFF
jgi:putative phage-type endonuclease